MIWANYPSLDAIERAIDEAFNVTKAAEQIREANTRADPEHSPETLQIIEMEEEGISLSEQVAKTGRSPSWINNNRRRLGMTDLRDDE